MFADVSGFTALTESYTLDGEKGVDALTLELNKYMGSIVEIILQSGGDILKYAGDAFLALWRVKKREDLRQALNIACKAAVVIQTNCDRYMTTKGIELRVKLALSAGKIYVPIVENMSEQPYTNPKSDREDRDSHNNSSSLPKGRSSRRQSVITGGRGYSIVNDLGGKFDSSINLQATRRRHFVEVGRPVGEVNKAEKKTNPGKIVLSPNAWDLCDKKIMSGEDIGDRFFELRFLKKDLMIDKVPPCVNDDVFNKRLINKKLTYMYSKQEHTYIRDCMKVKNNIPGLDSKMKEFIMPVVKEKLQDQQKLTYLSELRQVTVVFINLAFRQKLQDKKFYEKQAPMIQTAFEIVDREISENKGTVNKLFMFDKGCSILAVFGLPGSKHDGEAAHALQASFAVDRKLKENLQNLEYVSIGVTTGPVFVGVMGHPERHEYTIIGPKVNMAARIMMHYPKIVSCDSETRDQAKLAPWLYKKREYIKLKGVKNPGPIFEYSEDLGHDKEYFLGTKELQEPRYPLLGQDDALEDLSEECFQMANSTNHGLIRRLIVIEGEPGSGKTRLLEEVAYRAQESNNLVVFSIITITELNKKYSTVKMCLSLLLGLDQLKTAAQRKKRLAKMLDGTEFLQDLYVLNPILGLDFPCSESSDQGHHFQEDTEEYKKKTKNLVKNLVGLARKEHKQKYSVVFCLDDVNFVGEASWWLLQALAKDKQALIICTIRPDKYKDLCPSTRFMFDHPNTKKLTIQKVKNANDLTALCCQFLNVRQIDDRILTEVAKKSQGIPFWALEILKQMDKERLIFRRPIRIAQTNHSTPQLKMDKPCDRLIFVRNKNYRNIADSYTETENVEIGFENVNGNAISNTTMLGENYEPNNYKPTNSLHTLSTSRPKSSNWARRISYITKMAHVADSNRKSNRNDGNDSVIREKSDLSHPGQMSPSQSGHNSGRNSNISHAPAISYSIERSASNMGSNNGSNLPINASNSINKPIIEDFVKDDNGKILHESIMSDHFPDHLPAPISIVGLCVAKLDQMNAFSQLIVKCAAVLNKRGQEFSPKMLRSVIPGVNVSIKGQRKFEKYMRNLVMDRTFEYYNNNKTGVSSRDFRVSQLATHWFFCLGLGFICLEREKLLDLNIAVRNTNKRFKKNQIKNGPIFHEQHPKIQNFPLSTHPKRNRHLSIR